MLPLAILGFLTVVIMLVLIMTKKASPLVALIVVPVVTGIISCFFIAVVPEGAPEGAQGVVDFVANFKSLGGMITGAKGIGSVAATGVMFIFSILFFGILTDAGTFRPTIKGILNLVGTAPINIGIGTAILAAIVHLDGSGAGTFLICVPALLRPHLFWVNIILIIAAIASLLFSGFAPAVVFMVFYVLATVIPMALMRLLA